MQEDRPGPAEGVVVDALRRAPEDRELLDHARPHPPRPPRLGPRRPGGGDPARRQGDPVAPAMAAALDTARLAGEGRPEDAVALLEDLAAGGGDAPAMAELVRAQVAAGDPEAAPRLSRRRAGRGPGEPARPLPAGRAAARSRAGRPRPRRSTAR